MAAAVARVFEDGGVLLAEAGTGTGKTLAYLVPAILSRQRVLISTGTKNLQEQIFFKDIPGAARRARHPVHRDLHEGPRELPLPAPARSAGRRRRPARSTTSSCRSSASGRRAPTPAIAPSSRICRRTSRSGTTSRRPPTPASAPTARTTTTASSRGCASAPPKSDVVIVNHHLLCADAAVRQSAFGEVIPACHQRGRRRGAPARGRRDAVLRLHRQQLPPRGPGARRRAAGRDRRRRGPRARRTTSPRRSSGCAITRGRSSPSSRSRTAAADARENEERVRATAESLGQT